MLLSNGPSNQIKTSQKLPLVDLHRHLDGNINVATICALAKQFNVSLPSYNTNELAKYCQINDRTSDLLSFLAKLDYGVSVLGDYHACERIAYENVCDAAEQGLDYVELRFSPNYMAKAFSLDLDKVVEAVILGVKRGVSELKIEVNLIGILSRSYGVKECEDELNAILSFHKDIVALDLAGDELNYPASLFKQHFQTARDKGLLITVHAGEADGPKSIWQAIDLLGAQRIGHGVAAVQDKALMDYLKGNNIGVEACLTSNYQTGTYIDTKSHPINKFIEHGISVSLNTDDPGVSNITINDEYALAKSVVGLDETQILYLKRCGFEQAFMNDEQRLKVLSAIS
ncbi:adenosine deaminase [Glaciecola sp. KUL10]|uniref:adenosine deaminase n=1 Tax=Glaciecola sp. (strain KUL10) TaxID=2161813 RepID=UPI000D7894B6|nr:adenosine deaminase [Glaciecola sp. KUL10]GBL03010.1 adenosine deaminase [Glaciecola sp. KUL10]